jgi:hypothetical protein
MPGPAAVTTPLVEADGLVNLLETLRKEAETTVPDLMTALQNAEAAARLLADRLR